MGNYLITKLFSKKLTWCEVGKGTSRAEKFCSHFRENRKQNSRFPQMDSRQLVCCSTYFLGVKLVHYALSHLSHDLDWNFHRLIRIYSFAWWKYSGSKVCHRASSSCSPGPGFTALPTGKQPFRANYSRQICWSISIFHRLARELRAVRARSPWICTVASLICEQ